MSTITPFALGLGGGLALWYATKDRKPSPGGIPAALTPPVTTPRNADASSARTADSFTLSIYPTGIGGARKRVRWFTAEQPITWEAARDRLVVARIIDPRAIGPAMPGHWRLVTEPRAFDAQRAEALPGPVRPRGARHAQRFTREGRTILRTGEAIVRLERVDLGDQRYALSPHHADLLTERIVRLLNAKGAR